MGRRRRSTRSGFNFPEPLLEAMAEINPGFVKRNILPSLCRKDLGHGWRKGKMGFLQAKKRGGAVAIGPTSLSVGSYERFKKAAARMNVPLADLWRAVFHATLPIVEKAAERMPAPQPVNEVHAAGVHECPHCGK